MTDNTTNLLLDGITQLESAVFRAGQVARHLMSEHPDLTAKRVSYSVYGYIDEDDSDPGIPKLDLRADGLDGTRAWAQALGTELTLNTRGTTHYVFEVGECEADVDGVLVHVTGARALPDDEAAAWRTQQATAADGGESA